MTSKWKGSRLETEINNLRSECNWAKIKELLPNLKSKNISTAEVEYLQAECDLEMFIESLHKPGVLIYNEMLKIIEGTCLRVVKKLSEKNEQNTRMEAYLLLAKLHYFCGENYQALHDIERSRMDALTSQFVTLRSLKMVAEGYAIKGLAIESEALKGGAEKLDEDTRIKCFECMKMAVELGISYVSELEKNINHTNRPINNIKGDVIGHILGSVLRKLPILSMKGSSANKIIKWDIEGIEWYRKILIKLGDKQICSKAVEKFSKYLAEILVKHRFEKNNEHTSRTMGAKNQSLIFYSGSNHGYFCPNNNIEEILLLLFIAEALTSKDMICSKASDVSNTIGKSRANLKVIQSFMTLVLSSLGQYELLTNIFRRSMTYAVDDYQLWKFFIYSLIGSGDLIHATKVLRELILDVSETNSTNLKNLSQEYMFLSKLELDSSLQVDASINAALMALKKTQGTWMEGRATLLHAIAYSSKLQTTLSFDERKLVLAKSIALFEEAIKLDPLDDMAYFLSALNYSIARDLDMAQKRCNKAVELNPENPWNLMLLALILTARKNYEAASICVLEALEEYPSHYGLMVLRLKIEMKCGKVSEAIETSKNLLKFWKNAHKPCFNSYGPSNFSGEENGNTTIRPTNYSLTGKTSGTINKTPLPRDNGYSFTPLITNPITLLSNQSHVSIPRVPSSSDVFEKSSIVTSIFGTAPSEFGAVASTITESVGVKCPSNRSIDLLTTWRLQANIWVELAEMFIEYGKLSEVSSCIEEACNLFPNSHQCIYLKGKLLAKKAESIEDYEIKLKMKTEAKSCFLGALSISPSHIPSLTNLSKLYEEQEMYEMAEKLYRDAITIDPMNHIYWYELGKILSEQGRHIQALECFETSGALDKSTPVIPFSVIPKTIRCDM
ncbi:Lethal (2) k14710 [Strongyloides ratti]|uniref:Lethal (2) k14710 n=1 Tax=Strongyloides ratti TaxID=34506 RepID=A0A090LAP4_STRRB|nr:Lethal (2) k14710 [Strongyloides ratti]CEF64605.1 Lethal (2) k14710 [Strongyloides ratti]